MRGLFVGAAVLYALVAILLAGSLPAQVPLRFDADLTADRWATRGELMLLVCALGAVVIGAFAAVAARRSRLRAAVLELGTITLVFLAVELALVYGRYTGDVATGFPTPEAEASFVRAAQAGVELSPWTVALLAGYLVHLAVWACWVVTRRSTRPGPGRREPRTADSTA